MKGGLACLDHGFLMLNPDASASGRFAVESGLWIFPRRTYAGISIEDGI